MRPETCGKERNFPNLFGAYYRYVMVSTPLKNMSSSVGMIIANIWKNKKCSKPPTKYIYIRIYIYNYYYSLISLKMEYHPDGNEKMRIFHD